MLTAFMANGDYEDCSKYPYFLSCFGMHVFLYIYIKHFPFSLTLLSHHYMVMVYFIIYILDYIILGL